MGLCTYKDNNIPLTNLMIQKKSHRSIVRVACVINTQDSTEAII